MLQIWVATLMTALLIVDGLLATNCTDDEAAASSKLYTVLPAKCDAQVLFDVCEADCLAGYKTRMDKSPNCTASGLATTEVEVAAANYEDCRERNLFVARKYVPQASKGTLAKCTSEQKDVWYDKYDKVDSFFYECSSRASRWTGCSDACLSTIEQGISDDPVCADWSGYWYGEIQKQYLVRCLNARKDKLEYNVVLHAVINADGTKTVGGKFATSIQAPSTTTPSATSATASVAETTTSLVFVVFSVVMSASY